MIISWRLGLVGDWVRWRQRISWRLDDNNCKVIIFNINIFTYGLTFNLIFSIILTY